MSYFVVLWGVQMSYFVVLPHDTQLTLQPQHPLTGR
jgi:hypothetical protein